MLYRLVRPVKRPDSSVHHFVQRIPADVLPKAKGLVLSIPVGDTFVTRTVSAKAQVVKVSLGTRDPGEAKIRQGAIAGYLEGVWRSLRSGPATLNHKQTVALAGEVYKALTTALEGDPGSPTIWRRVKEDNALARTGRYGRAPLTLSADQSRRLRRSLEERFGGFVDVALAKRALVIDDDSRVRLLMQVAQAVELAADRLEANACGDYSPDATAARFPEWEEKKQPEPKAGKTSLSVLLADWWKEAEAAGKTPSTYESYSRTVRVFIGFLKHDDAARVTAEDVVAFKDHRLAQINPRTGKKVSAATVKDSDLAALKSVFGWAVANKRLSENPAQGVTVKKGKRVRLRSSSFTSDEAIALLRAAKCYRAGPIEHAKTAAAKRWVPWLCAYSGARVGEMAQLRKQDVRQEDGHWIMEITPAAGTVKTKEARAVPLHDHLVEQGFLEFVKEAGDGHLFLALERGEAVAGKWQALKNRLQEFARTIVKDRNVQPNHGWRHTFKDIGLDAGIEGRVLDAIAGHAPRSQGEGYGSRGSIKAKAAAMKAFPRFEVD